MMLDGRNKREASRTRYHSYRMEFHFAYSEIGLIELADIPVVSYKVTIQYHRRNPHSPEDCPPDVLLLRAVCMETDIP